MLFHSFSFLLFFPLVTGMYFLIPKRAKQLWLLVASYYFYMSWNVQYGCLILLVTAIGYGGGLLLAQNKVRQGKRRLAVLTGSVLLCVGILFFFKYFAFAVQNINELLRAVGSVRALRVPDRCLEREDRSGKKFPAFCAVCVIFPAACCRTDRAEQQSACTAAGAGRVRL